MGDWKLVQERGGEAQLFNLKTDISETDRPRRQRAGEAEGTQAAYAAGQRDDARAMDSAGRPHATGGRGKRPPARRWDRGRFKQFDRNADGKLTPDELPRCRLFRQMDTDNDGVVTLDEVRPYYSGRRQKAKQEE